MAQIKLFFFRLVEAALKGAAARCPPSPSPVTPPVLWETSSSDHLCLFFPGFSFSSPALSTCVGGSIVYIPGMLGLSMDHIPRVCRSFHQHLPAFPSFSFSIVAPLIFQCKSPRLWRVWLSPPSCFHWLGPSFLCQYMFGSVTGLLVSLTFSDVAFGLVGGFSKSETGFPVCVCDRWSFEAEPPLLLFYDTSRITTTTTCEMKKRPGPFFFFTILVAVWILHTPQLKCSERILGQLRSLLVRGIVLLLNWGDIHMLLISGKNSGESDKRALFIFSLFFVFDAWIISVIFFYPPAGLCTVPRPHDRWSVPGGQNFRQLPCGWWRWWRRWFRLWIWRLW